jgi:hypothetical protein
MAIVRGIAATAMFTGLALGLAAPATAANQMSGHYIETETQPSGEPSTYDWYFAPCGDGCASVTGGHGGQIGQAQLVNGQWTLDVTGATLDCSDGTSTPNALNYHYTWDPDSLAGTVQITQTLPSCGYPVGKQFTSNVQLTQAP